MGCEQQADYDVALPVLQAWAKNIVHCGPAGNGPSRRQRGANNMLLAISMIGPPPRQNESGVAGWV